MRALYAHDRLEFEEKAARTALLGLLEAPHRGRVFLVESGGALTGYIVLTLGWSLEYRGMDAFIDELFVDEAFRGRGLGKAAVERVVRAARALGVRALHLEVERANLPAQELYRKIGFEDHDRYLLTRWIRKATPPRRRARALPG